MTETFYDVMRRQGITRRSFIKFCSLTASALGLGPAFVPRIAEAMETKPRIPVLWLHGLERTCCSESFIRSAHPLAKDVVLSMISLDYDDTIMGGKDPHPNWMVGVVPCSINMDGDMEAGAPLNMVTLNQISLIIDQTREFIKNVCIPDLLAVGKFYKGWLYGGGLSSMNVLSCGDIPDRAND